MVAEDVVEACNAKAGFPAGTPLLVFNDIKQNMLEKVVGNEIGQYSRFGGAMGDVSDLDLLIFQKVSTPDESERLGLNTVREYFK